MVDYLGVATFEITIAAGLFIAMLGMLEVGRRIGRHHYARDPENAGKGLGPIQGAMLSLMGLLIAFTFSGAGARFDARRQLIVQETNAIGTAYLRLTLLPAAAQPPMRERFRQYLDARLAFYANITDDAARAQAAKRTAALQAEIWNQAVAATHQLGGEATANAGTTLLLQALNQMIDVATTRLAAYQAHPPWVVYGTLLLLVLAFALLAGYEIAAQTTRNWFHMIGFAAIVTLSILIIIDYEYPRVALIRLDPVDQLLIELRASMS